MSSIGCSSSRTASSLTRAPDEGRSWFVASSVIISHVSRAIDVERSVFDDHSSDDQTGK
jgi:hypothetical protein